ncbi:UAA transporter [Cylindrobasidium torrendii FP15055 ss-10]|uniref:UAA transporter n=1 Tax=Cylindrobasidium torrendii FP15055 ss-10 TaxID=1314674 RepID=A0A0D7AUJ0_9AGAR|nr:UAA transporter [Cylindrobasidium torrendii FP15055 ss-10]
MARANGHVPKELTPIQAASVLFDYTTIFTLVFGGCCSNVWLYENLLILNPRIGSALTFTQMVFITSISLPAFLVWPKKAFLPQLRPRQVPLAKWALQVIVLSSGSLLNNWAYSYNVPLSVLMVFRSAGLPVSMLFGWLFMKRKYTLLQITAVLMVTLGVTIATLSNKKASATPTDAFQYAMGVCMLVVSLLCTASLGMMQERTYKRYGPCWKEGVFYTHFISLPIFLFLGNDVKQGLESLSANSTVSPTVAWSMLCGNLITQLVCVSGVNKLTSSVSSVSTNVVLTTRKAVSLCFSVWYFKNGWNAQFGLGAAMVFTGSILYSAGSWGEDAKTEKPKVE